MTVNWPLTPSEAPVANSDLIAVVQLNEDGTGVLISKDFAAFAAAVSNQAAGAGNLTGLSYDLATNELVLTFSTGATERVLLGGISSANTPGQDDALIYENGSWRAEKVHGDNVATGTIQPNNLHIQNRAGGRVIRLNDDNNAFEGISPVLFSSFNIVGGGFNFSRWGQSNIESVLFVGPASIRLDNLNGEVTIRMAPQAHNDDIGKMLVARANSFGQVRPQYEALPTPRKLVDVTSPNTDRSTWSLTSDQRATLENAIPGLEKLILTVQNAPGSQGGRRILMTDTVEMLDWELPTTGEWQVSFDMFLSGDVQSLGAELNCTVGGTGALRFYGTSGGYSLNNLVHNSVNPTVQIWGQ